MKVKDLLLLLENQDEEEQVFLSVLDSSNNEILGELNGMYRTVKRDDFNVTAIMLTQIENPTSI